MKKEPTLTDEFHSMMESLSRKKNKSISELEELKKRVLFKIDSQLDALYKKRDYIREVIANKRELRKHRLGVLRKITRKNIWTTLKKIISMPFIYIMVIPGIVTHTFLEIYHQICFRLYGIPLVNPKEYFIFDRSRLPQLNWLEKFNCFYCSYFNCLVSYMQEIIGRTEKFWCPIKHARRMSNVHDYYDQFVDYSDAKNLRTHWKKMRKFEDTKKRN